MLTYDAEWVDVSKFLLEGVQPVAISKRPYAHSGGKAWAGSTQVGQMGEFWVPETHLFDERVLWRHTKIGEAVRIPMFPYDTGFRVHSALVAVGVQIGMVSLLEMMKHTRDTPLHVKLVLGEQVTDLSPAEEKFRCYIGIAIQTK